MAQTTLEKLERKTMKTGNEWYRSKRFIEALGNPQAWVYSGDCYDAGPESNQQCVCGHHIRYVFIIAHGERTAQVGSECINHFQEFNPSLHADLTEALTKLEANLAEGRRQAREARQQEEVEAARAEWRPLADKVENLKNCYRAAGLYLPHKLYYATTQVPEYKRASSYVKWYRESAEHLRTVVAQTRVPYGYEI